MLLCDNRPFYMPLVVVRGVIGSVWLLASTVGVNNSRILSWNWSYCWLLVLVKVGQMEVFGIRGGNILGEWNKRKFWSYLWIMNEFKCAFLPKSVHFICPTVFMVFGTKMYLWTSQSHFRFLKLFHNSAQAKRIRAERIAKVVSTLVFVWIRSEWSGRNPTMWCFGLCSIAHGALESCVML